VCLQFGCLVVDIPEDLQAEQVTLPERSRYIYIICMCIILAGILCACKVVGVYVQN
jgi:hypothetical protein